MSNTILTTNSDKIQIVSVTDRINQTLKEPFDSYDPRAREVKRKAIQALKENKIKIYLEGPLGIGKGTTASRLAETADLLYSLENPEAPEVKRYLQMLYHHDLEIKKMGALGVNLAYYPQRMAQEERANRSASSYVLDRYRRFDKLYMNAFVESGLMKANERDAIIETGDREMKLINPRGYTAGKVVVVQMIASPELVYRRKNRRARDVETETKEGGGVGISYITDINNRYLQSPSILEEEGFEGLIVEVGQELDNGFEFAPENERHMLPLLEVLAAYADSRGPTIDTTNFSRS